MLGHGSRWWGLAAAIGGVLIGVEQLWAQQGPPALPPPQGTPAQPAAIAPYRAPIIAMVQPANDAAVPQDKPVVVFRFMQGEPSDPIDLASFAAVVDGVDRTQLFQITAAEAWGPLGAVTSAPGDSALTIGAHQLTARICSARGACGHVSVTVSVVASAASGSAAEKSAPARRKKLVEAVLEVVRKLLIP